MADSIQFELIRSSRRSISIHVNDTGSVVVKAPYLVPRIIIDRFVSQKRDWIAKQLSRISSQPVLTDEYLYLGNSLPIRIGEYPAISASTALNFPRFLLFRKDKELSAWYQAQARKLITERVRQLAARLDTQFGTITFSDTKSKWGSCDKDNNLQFSWRLIMAPLLVIDYVIIHELAHTLEKNHGRRFWALVSSQKPAYKQYIKWLRDHSHRMNLQLKKN